MKIMYIVAINFHPIFMTVYQPFGTILDFGSWPPASPSYRLCPLAEPEAAEAINAHAPEGLRICLYRFVLSS
jgi:hypothetical protein